METQDYTTLFCMIEKIRNYFKYFYPFTMSENGVLSLVHELETCVSIVNPQKIPSF